MRRAGILSGRRVADIMFKIQEQAGVPSKQQKLIFAGKQLEGGVYEEPHVQVSPDTLHHQVAASATGGPRIVVHS